MLHPKSIIACLLIHKMFIRFGFLFTLGFSYLFLCEGKIFPPAHGTSLIVKPGSIGRIVWSFNNEIKRSSYRIWTFSPSDGEPQVDLASISGDGAVQILNTSYEVAVEKPATLVLKNVSIIHNGTYEFSLSPGASPSQVVVYIAVKPNATACSSNITVNEGDNASCVCKGQDGNPPANVTWYKDNRKIGETGKEEKTLTFTNASEKHRGSYKCVAQSYSNDSFRDEDIVQVIVIPNYQPTKPDIILPDQNIAFVGKIFTITCVADGLPEPSYTIMHNGSLMVSDEATYSRRAEWDDAGTYTCTAKNKLGTNSSSATLIVQEKTATQSSSESTTKSATQPATRSSSKSSERTTHGGGGSGGLTTGAIVGICVGVLLLLVIVVIVVYHCSRLKEKDERNHGSIDPPIAGCHYEPDNEELVEGNNTYDTVAPAASGSKSRAPNNDTLPPVYAAVDVNNRQGNTLYASLDTDAMKPKRESKKEPDRVPQTEYASIDFAKTANAPKAGPV